jgi:hydroxymethylglutaryl-CoA reductase
MHGHRLAARPRLRPAPVRRLHPRGAAAARSDFLREQSGASLEHVGTYSQDPAELPGNIEHFTGVAQVPLGIAGPLLVDGEHAQGEFYVPMATAEGTLVASYNRGMKLLRRTACCSSPACCSSAPASR